MGALVYSVIASLDRYVADTDGGFDWAAPDAEVHAFVNERMRTAGSHLLGRRSFEVMHWWEGPGPEVEPAVEREFRQVWQDADKVVFSTTLADVTAPRARLVRSFDPEAVRRIKAGAPRDLTVGGPGLAAAALRPGLVDSVELFLVPVVVRGGTRALPDGVRLGLGLVESRTFSSGTVWLRYDVRG